MAAGDKPVGFEDQILADIHTSLQTLLGQFTFDESALIGMDIVRSSIHDGTCYGVIDVVDLAINNVRDLQITTPDDTDWAHATFQISTESETEWYLYRDVTIILPGTAVTPRNANHNSTNETGIAFKHIDNISVANANADTAVGAATEIYHGICGAGKDAGIHSLGHEIVLEQNTIYCLRLIANTAGFVNYHVDWCEHAIT